MAELINIKTKLERPELLVLLLVMDYCFCRNYYLCNKLTGDLLALDIRRCLHYLGEITGEITNEDQLDYIFSKFCIGR